jgi:S-DNA-T family DNA segregation ATPase FtsK/SpoIIIE
MIKSNKKRKRRNTKKKKSELNKEIIGIAILAFSVLSLFSMYSNSTGVVGAFIKEKFNEIAGFGGFIIPYIILIIGVLFILNRLKLNESKKSVLLILVFVCFLTLIHISYLSKLDETASKLNFFNLIESSIEFGKLGNGGGLIGAIVSFLFLKLFGFIGSYIVIATILLIAFLLLTNVSIISILKKISRFILSISKNSFSVIKDFIYVEDNKEIINENIEEESKEKLTEDILLKTDLKPEVNNEDTKDQKIKILDFTNDLNIDNFNKEESYNKDRNLDENREFAIETKGTSIISQENSISYVLPILDLLEIRDYKPNTNEKKDILDKAQKLEETLNSFGIKAKVIQISRGPTITRYELQPAPGVKVSRIVNLSNDIALSLATSDIRIEAPIPGKSAIGIEVPNESKTNVSLREIFESEEFKQINTKIPFALGKDIAGKPIVTNIEKMPHLLIAGATGSGKSVCINALITSILYKAKPDEVKLLLIDPKVVELSIYNGIPHLIVPVVTDPKKAAGALNWAVEEMTSRYKKFAQLGVRDIFSYNSKAENDENIEKLPQIVVIIDELADLMMVSPAEVEDSICRLAQMARAAGIHLIVATQRPSVDIITGTIKANIPSRIAFAVSSQADSRTILDMGGAEKLLGKGDMLFYPVGASKPLRIQGAYIDEKEVERVVEFLKEQTSNNYNEEVINNIEKEVNIRTDESDDLLSEAIQLVVNEGQASISFLQRKLRIGYSRAARLIDAMEERGIVGGYEGSKPRKVLIAKEDLEN